MSESVKIARIPSSEGERIAALKECEILDTKAEEVYDELVEMASLICDVPISLVSLVDSDRQWFKAKCGLEVSETPRDVAFCAHAILQDDVMVVEDTLLDDRFRENALVVGAPNIRFYAGCPLITTEGYALGTLCVIDHVPKKLSERHIRGLRSLGRQVVANIELRTRAKKLDRMNEEKNRFFSILSHDLRSPLASIVSMSNALMNEKIEFDDVQKREWLSAIEDSAAATLDIAENLLQHVQFEEGRNLLKLEDLSVAQIVEDLRKQLSGKARLKGVDLRVDQEDDLCIKADDRMMHSILHNLVSNALKFSEENSSVVIHTRQLDGFVEVCVCDSGRGMSADDLNRIRSKNGFSTLGTRGEQGSGLGIMLCREFVEKQGGDLEIESELGQGTTVTLHLPLGGVPSVV